MTNMTPDERAELLRYRAGASKLQDHIEDLEGRLFDRHGMVMDLRKRLEKCEQARQRAEEGPTADSLTVMVEDWLHNHLDAEFRPTPRATMRWQWCKRPGYPKDHDCAACLMTPEEAATEGKVDSGCECICHERVRSLVAFLLAALAPDAPKESTP